MHRRRRRLGPSSSNGTRVLAAACVRAPVVACQSTRGLFHLTLIYSSTFHSGMYSVSILHFVAMKE
uniref:Uncharacterized protein n=1 Tax=Zea mays TaxID=4577 RepID=B4FIC4_MAIZE|nr:unknown [Zea mays]